MDAITDTAAHLIHTAARYGELDGATLALVLEMTRERHPSVPADEACAGVDRAVWALAELSAAAEELARAARRVNVEALVEAGMRACPPQPPDPDARARLKALAARHVEFLADPRLVERVSGRLARFRPVDMEHTS